MGPISYLATADLEQQIIGLATRTVVFASIALVVLAILASLLKKQKSLKLPLFIMMAVTMVGTTLVLLGGTVYLNVKSDSGGPVHWHTGIEFWSCGAEVNLRDPIGVLSNKVGTATYHEHNDKYIHLEGVVVEKEEDASLGKFMRVTGGKIGVGSVKIPLSADKATWFAHDDQLDGDPQRPENFDMATGNESWITREEKGAVLNLVNGKTCGNETVPAEVQVFVYSFDKDSKTYSQKKLEKPEEYIMRAESALGPPSDCVIVEFDTPRERTDKLCEQYGIKDATRCTQFGVKEFSTELCNIRETTPSSTSTPANNASSTDYSFMRSCQEYMAYATKKGYQTKLSKSEVTECRKMFNLPPRSEQ